MRKFSPILFYEVHSLLVFYPSSFLPLHPHRHLFLLLLTLNLTVKVTRASLLKKR